jgi:hypothetical protein
VLRSLSIVLGALVVFSACKQPEEAVYVARAYDKVLTLEELMDILPDNLEPEDSAAMAQSYINTWIRERVLLHIAEQNLPPEEKGFERQLESYRNSLTVYSFEQAVVANRLDTVVRENEMRDYYEANQKDFILKDFIVRAKFCVLPNDPAKLKKIRTDFFEGKSDKLEKIEEFCVDNGYPYFVNIDQWIYFDELLLKVPISVFDAEGFLKKNKAIEFEKDDIVYFLYIYEYMLKDDVSPFELERDKIRNIILTKRKTDLLTRVKTELYNDAVAKNKVEIRDLP